MKNLFNRTVIIFVILIAGFQIDPAKAVLHDISANKIAARVHFEDDFGLIFLPVRVNNSKPLWFLLDTGFDVNILNAKWSKQLKIELKDKQVVPQPGGAIEM